MAGALSPTDLLDHVRRLDPDCPIHRDLEDRLSIGSRHSSVWYTNQKEHWIGWLSEYDGPGAYGRATGQARTAAFVYNHIQCVPMLAWLAEAAGVSSDLVRQGCDAAATKTRDASQCGAFRKIVQWSVVESRFRPLKDL